MRRRSLPILFAFAGVAAAGCQGGAEASPSGTAASYLFVIDAPTGSFDGTTLTLVDVPSVVYFSDRPERKAGHVTVDEYVATWTPPANDPNFDPPNADLQVLGPDGPANAVVELKSVAGDSARLTFEIGLLEGTIPGTTFGPVALFVDTCDITYPLCPGL